MTFDFFYCIGNLRDQLRFKFEFVHSKKRILCCTFLCLKRFLHFWRTSLRNTLTVLVPSVLMCKVMFIMNWEMFEMLHHPWQSVFKRAFQKGRICPCNSRDTKAIKFEGVYLLYQYGVFRDLHTTMTSCNFYAPWYTRSCFTLLHKIGLETDSKGCCIPSQVFASHGTSVHPYLLMS